MGQYLMLSIGTTYLSGNAFFKKADDRIEINSVISKKVNTYWNYSAYLNFRSQILPGYRYFKKDGEDQKEEISRILSPAIIQMGLGWYYKEGDLAWFNILHWLLEESLSAKITPKTCPRSKIFWSRERRL